MTDNTNSNNRDTPQQRIADRHERKPSRGAAFCSCLFLFIIVAAMAGYVFFSWYLEQQHKEYCLTNPDAFECL